MDDRQFEMDWVQLFIGMFGSIALFLYSMKMIEEVVKTAAGDRLNRLLAMASSRRWLGLATGALVTALVQSSTVTSVMAVSFVNSGLLSISQALGLILGASLGTTINGQIVALKMTKYALLWLGGGYVVGSLQTRGSLGHSAGEGLVWSGMLFLSMNLLSAAILPLQSYTPFLMLLESMAEYNVLGVLAGAVFTAIVQSSSATVAVVILLATEGAVSLSGGASVVIGANIGTTLTSVLVSLSKGDNSRRVAFAQVTIKILTATLVLLTYPLFMSVLYYVSGDLSPESPNAKDRMGRAIANAHTLFNLVVVILFGPGFFDSIVLRIVNFVVISEHHYHHNANKEKDTHGPLSPGSPISSHSVSNPNIEESTVRDDEP